MQDHRDEQRAARPPEQPGIGGIVQEGGVYIDLVRVAKNLQVAQQVSHDVAEEDHTGYGHDDLLPDGGFIEADDPMYGIDRNCTHAEILCSVLAACRAARDRAVDFNF